MITIRKDGTIDPLGINWTGESNFELMAPTRDISETTYADGEYDFGMELETGEYQLHCASEEGLTKEEMNSIKAELVGLLNLWREYDLLVWESDPNKGLHTRVSGTVEFTDYPGWFEVTIPLRYQPLWVSVEEQSHTGSGTITNEGTFEASIVIEIMGTVTNPNVTIGSETLVYTGTLAAGDKVVVDTGRHTVKFNEVNALGNYNGMFPKLPPGETSIIASNNVTLKWRHCFI